MEPTQNPKKQLVHTLLRTVRFHRAVVESRVGDTGVHRSQSSVMIYLSHQKEPPTQKELATAMEVSPAAMTVTLRKLEDLGLVERVPQTGNARANTVALTESGAEALKKGCAIFTEIDNRMMDGFTDAELTQLQSYLNRIQDNLKKILPELENDTDGPVHPQGGHNS